MKLWGMWLVALPVVALAIVGCGGGGGSDSTESTSTATTKTTAQLTKAELIEQGDAICGEVNAAVGAIKPGTPEATARIAGLYSGMVKSLKALGPPQETEGALAEYLRTLGELEVVENELKLAAERGSSTSTTAAEGALSSFQLYAGEYGFKECSEGPKTPTASSSSGAAAESGEAEASGGESEAVEPEASEPAGEEETAPEAVPETGGAEGGGSGAPETGSGSGGGSSGGIGPG